MDKYLKIEDLREIVKEFSNEKKLTVKITGIISMEKKIGNAKMEVEKNKLNIYSKETKEFEINLYQATKIQFKDNNIIIDTDNLISITISNY